MTGPVAVWQVAAWNFVVLAAASISTFLVGIDSAVMMAG
jgi:hypothetical protein